MSHYCAAAYDQDLIDEGHGFDGSSIRGFKVINESDMLLMPDPTTAFIDPFMAHKTLVMIADVKDPVTKEFYSRDPRGIGLEAYRRGKASAGKVGALARARQLSELRFSVR